AARRRELLDPSGHPPLPSLSLAGPPTFLTTATLGRAEYWARRKAHRRRRRKREPGATHRSLPHHGRHGTGPGLTTTMEHRDGQDNEDGALPWLPAAVRVTACGRRAWFPGGGEPG